MISTQVSDYCMCGKFGGRRHATASLVLSNVDFATCFETGSEAEAQTNVALCAADQMTGLWNKIKAEQDEKTVDSVVRFPSATVDDFPPVG